MLLEELAAAKSPQHTDARQPGVACRQHVNVAVSYIYSSATIGTKLPERLCELALMEVSNPGAVIDKQVAAYIYFGILFDKQGITAARTKIQEEKLRAEQERKQARRAERKKRRIYQTRILCLCLYVPRIVNDPSTRIFDRYSH